MAVSEWLEGLRESRARYRRLLDESGSMAVAAHRLARAKCQTWMQPTDVPNAREVHAAAYEIAEHLGMTSDLPALRTLATQCRERGLALL